MYYYFINVRVAQNVWAIVTDSMERRMAFSEASKAVEFARRMGISDYAVQRSQYTKEYNGYQ